MYARFVWEIMESGQSHAFLMVFFMAWSEWYTRQQVGCIAGQRGIFE